MTEIANPHRIRLRGRVPASRRLFSEEIGELRYISAVFFDPRGKLIELRSRQSAFAHSGEVVENRRSKRSLDKNSRRWVKERCHQDERSVSLTYFTQKHRLK